MIEFFGHVHCYTESMYELSGNEPKTIGRFIDHLHIGGNRLLRFIILNYYMIDRKNASTINVSGVRFCYDNLHNTL